MSKFSPVFMRSANNYDMDAASNDSGLACLDPSLTQQSDKDDADINTILERFARSGSDINALASSSSRPQYDVDVSNIGDYHSSLNSVLKADAAFSALPASLRARFSNSAGNLLDFLSDPSNRDEAIKLGLLASSPSGAPPATGKAVGGPKGGDSKNPSKTASKSDSGGDNGGD
jgi:phage internal scaffolding protein